MKKFNVSKKLMTVLVVLNLILIGCTNNEIVSTEDQEIDFSEVVLSSEIDKASETMDDIALDVYESQEASDSKTGKTTGGFFPLPDCVTVTLVAKENFRALTIDFGTEGCEVRGHILKGKIMLSYNRNPEAKEVLITKTLEDFYFDDKNIIGGKTILKQRSNSNGNPQYTRTVDLTVVWPDGTEATRTGTKSREWIEGHGSGIWSDNVFEITGNWASTFKNGNTHSYEVVIPLRREIICHYFVSGSVNIVRTNFSGVFDYGDGNCDNSATFTFADGTVKEITLN